MTTKLGLINNALLEVGHRSLEDTGEDVEAGRLLNTVYDQVLLECLSAGSWNFATETIMADADTGVAPEFGAFTEVFAKPTDFIRTVAISQDPDLSLPLLHYYDDVNFWSAAVTPIYVRYISSDTGMGLELTRWPALFARYVELELAARVAFRISQSEDIEKMVHAKKEKARKQALNVDAMNEAQPKFAPAGSWTTSRSGAAGGSDRGSRGSLTG